MAEVKTNWIAGEELAASDVNSMGEIINKAGALRDSLHAGETISAAALPIPVFQKSSDGELYKSDANDTDRIYFDGFATSDGTDGNDIDFQAEGIVGGFTGLTPGALYYIQDAVGTIGTTPGTYMILVGKALNATEINIIKKDFHIKKNYVLGESVTVTTPKPVCVGDDSSDTLLTITVSDPNTYTFGHSAAQEKQAQSFQEAAVLTINQIKATLNKYGSPSDSCKVSIQTDNANTPSGSILAYGTVLGSTLSGAETTITLDTTIETVANTRYWIVFERTGSLNSDNNYVVTGDESSSVYANGNGMRYSNGSWTLTSAAYDYGLKIDLKLESGKVYIGDANNSARDGSFLGFILATAALGATVPIIISGLAGGFSGLTPGAMYYVQDTIGTIGVTPGTATIQVGMADTTGEIIIDR